MNGKIRMKVMFNGNIFFVELFVVVVFGLGVGVVFVRWKWNNLINIFLERW